MSGPDGISRVASAIGTGPVDAAYKAIDALVRVPADLTDYTVTSVTEGIEALARTRVAIKPAGRMSNEGYVASAQGNVTQRTYSGNGADNDIVVASARAYVSALNKMIGFLSAQEKAKAAAASASMSDDDVAPREGERPSAVAA
jgi:2-isopropylmalate synthase